MAEETVSEPTIQEAQTGKQRMQLGSWDCNLPGLPNVRSEPRLYRRMRNNPTVALARALSYAPIRSAAWGYEVNDDVSDDMLLFVQDQIDPIKDFLVSNMLYGQDYGYQAFEKVWGYEGGQWVYTKIKPLLPELTEPLIDEKTGAFLGLKNQGVPLDPMYCFWYAHEREGDNLLGRARSENVKIPYLAWEQMVQKQAQYITKVAGVIPIVEYPEGQGRDASGNVIDNFRLAMGVLENLGKARGVAMPNTMIAYAQDLIARGVTTKELLRAWSITFLEAQGSHGSQFVEQMKHQESLIMRGWFQPERSATEGQFGTKAESEQHGQIALTIAEFTLKDMTTYVNKYLLNPLVVLNYGPQWKDTIKVVPERLVDDIARMIKGTMQQIFSSNPDMLQAFTDIDQVMDMSGWPKRQEILEADPSLEKEEQPVPPGTDPEDTPPPEEDDTDVEIEKKLAVFQGTIRRIAASIRPSVKRVKAGSSR